MTLALLRLSYEKRTNPRIHSREANPGVRELPLGVGHLFQYKKGRSIYILTTLPPAFFKSGRRKKLEEGGSGSALIY